MRSDVKLVEEKALLDAKGIDQALAKMADEIRRRHTAADGVLLAGIRTGGVHLAQELKTRLEAAWKSPVDFGTLDITLYRDDLFNGLPRPQVGETTLPPSLEGRRVILVDDVLFTGRTIRSALMELADFGRPAGVELAVLIDRGHRELPIRADYVGLTLETQRDQTVRVDFDDDGRGVRAFLARKAS